MKKIILYFCLTLLFSQVWASDKKFQNEVLQLEKDILAELNKKNVGEESIFYHYLLAGRETYTMGVDEYSQKYFTKALEMSVHENKTEAYINLIAIAHRNKNMSGKKKLIEDFSNYLQKNSAYATSEIKSYLNFLQTGKPDQLLVPYFGYYSSQKTIEELVIQKSYLQAFSMLNPEAMGEAEIGLKTTYDLLNVLVNKKKTKKLFCQPTLAKFPDAYSYSMKICSALVQFKKEGKVSPFHIEDLKKYFEKNHQNKSYLLGALEDLK